MKALKSGEVPGSPILPHIHFGNKKYTYKALIDSGSDISIISCSVFQKISKKNVLSCTKNGLNQLTSASGHHIKPLAKAQVRVYIANIPCVVNFIIIQNFRFGVLLGSDFLYQHRASLDLGTNTLFFKNRTVLLKSKFQQSTQLLRNRVATILKPYSVTYLRLKPSRQTADSSQPQIVTPLVNVPLFQHNSDISSQPVLLRPSQFVLPIVNEGAREFFVKKGTIVAVSDFV